MFNFLKPPAHIARLPKELIDPTYKRLRLQIYISIFIGYMAYYFIRKNFAIAIPEMEKIGYSKTELGFALSGVSLSYGLSKFFMGNVSDRSNPKYFLSLGLIFSAITMLFMGIYFKFKDEMSILAMFILLFLNGWFQGMGWPACGRSMVHWWSQKERGKVVATWNVAHNVGGGLAASLAIWGFAYFNEWQAILYFPAIVAMGFAILCFFIMRDTPQSCGLPSIEEYKNDYPENYSEKDERELNAKEIFVEYVIKNKYLWMIAVANVFVYFIRYGALDWAPAYLQQEKNFSLKDSGWAYTFYEFAAIPGTIICGWISDHMFNGRRAPVGVIFMLGSLISILVYWLSPPGHPLVDSIALISLGFFIYGPVMLIGLHALELAPKKAAGTAAGFTGLFGYLGGSILASAAVGIMVEKLGWNSYFISLVVASLLSIIFISFTWYQGGIKDKK